MITSLLFFSYLTGETAAQNKSGSIKGRVTTSSGEPLIGVSIMLQGTDLGSATDKSGNYIINRLKPGNYILIISGVGYKKQSHPVSLKEDQTLILNSRLYEEAVTIDEVIVKGKSDAQSLREKGYQVDVIESKGLKNFSHDINSILKTASGVNLRETGGLGSGFQLSLNGLSGNQIRYFIDGVPMENFGSSLSLNNFPLNLVEKLEVYKGIVPISLGSDALGGAVNIVTDQWQSSYLDAAYSYGSFNTSRGSLNGQYADNRTGLFLKGSFYYNNSDNNYLIRNAPVYDLELGNYVSSRSVKRFHDDYTSAMLQAEAGIYNTSIADKFSFKVTASGGRKNYQHPDNNILRVFGDFHTKNNSLLFSAGYRKRIGNFEIKAHALTGNINETVIDTSRRKYNWNGDFVERLPGENKGELLERRSLMQLDDEVLRSNIGIDYALTNIHQLSISFNQNYLKRTGDDIVDEFNRSFESPNFINKNMMGIAYTLRANLFETSVFIKKYWYDGKIISFDYADNEITTKPSLDNTGYGITLSYQPAAYILFKSSFEKAYRIPESYEILGDGIYINSNPSLSPEKSYNLNVGSLFSGAYGKFEIKAETNLFYRMSDGFIRFSPLGPFGQYENLNNVNSEGVEAGLSVSYNEFLSVTSNLTYQNITDQTKLDEGLQNKNYKSRVPNLPYLFANAVLGLNPNPGSSNSFNIYIHFRYVEEFFLMWENLGDRTGKHIIPSQFTQDIQADYSIYDGLYNFSFSVNNIWDELVFDNYNIQKPGRSYTVKLRYFLK